MKIPSHSSFSFSFFLIEYRYNGQLWCLRLSQQIQQMLKTSVIFSWGTKIWAGESLPWRQTILLTCTPLPHGFGQLLVAGVFNKAFVAGRVGRVGLSIESFLIRIGFEYGLLLNCLFITIRFSNLSKDVGSVEKGLDEVVKRVYLQLYSSCDQPLMVFFWKNARLKYSVWCQLVFYMTQKIHNNFFTMTKIGRITMPEALSCLHSFITLKTSIRYCMLPFFWYCCYQHDSSLSVNASVSTSPSAVASPSTSAHITELL